MNSKKYLILTASILILLNSCTDNGIIPQNTGPGRRDYIWVVDTVVSPQNYPFKTLYRLWASSPTDVWATGLGGNSTADIFHFDGVKWISSGDRYEGKYLIPGYQPSSIFGFGPNDVYLGCDRGRIFHYDGNGMKEVAALTKDKHNDIVFDNMWGDNSNNIYAFGAYPDSQLLANGSVIANYSNNNWTMINTYGLNGIVEHLYKNNIDNNIYLQVIKWSKTYDSTFIYQYTQNKYTLLYKTIWGKYCANISIINGEVHFILNNVIAKRINGKFQTVLNLASTNFYENIWGRNSKDIFLEMTDGLAHYNGTDIEYLFYFNKTHRTQIFGAAIFEKDVFFLVYESQTGLSVVYHGKLNG